VSWLILAFVVPPYVAWRDGSTYSFAYSLSAVGLLACSVNAILITSFLSRRTPSMLEEDTWELTAGTGVVPRWVSIIGLIGVGLVPSGLVVATLLFFGLVANRA
jgi:hypothetical protein